MSNLAPIFNQKEAEYGLPAGYLGRTARIESGLNPRARNPNSSASGLFQFIDSTARDYGLSDPFDPIASTDAAARLASDNAAILRQSLGREPTAGELYLAHQQGAGGAAKLLSNPNASASDVVGSAAAGLNGGGGQSAADFSRQWTGKFDDLSGGGGDAMMYGGAGSDALEEPYVPPSNPGGLGGLGGFLQSDGASNFFQSLGLSIATSPSNNMLQNMPTLLERFEERSDKRRTELDDWNAMTAALRKAGFSPEEAEQYARSPAAAKMVVDLQTAERTRQSNQTFARGLISPGSDVGGGSYLAADAVDPAPVDEAEATVGGLAPRTLGTMMQPEPLGQRMPDRGAPTAASGPASRAPIPAAESSTYQHAARLYAEEDRLRRAAIGATTADQRAAAETALDGVTRQITRVESVIEKMQEAPDLETFWDEESGREFKGYYDPRTQQPVRVGGMKAAPKAGAFDMTLPDGTSISLGGGEIPKGFQLDPNNPGGVMPIPGGPAEQLPAELAGRIAIADSFLGQVPDIQKEINAGSVTGVWDRFQAGNSSQSGQASTYRKLQSGADALQRLLTGAGMTETEALAYAGRYLPGYTDDAASAADKLNQLQREVENARASALRGRGGTGASFTPNGPKRGAAPDPLGIR